MKTIIKFPITFAFLFAALMLLPLRTHADGGVPLWTNRYNGPAYSHDHANAIATDPNGNVFVTGYSSNGANRVYATVAYSSDGTLLWSNNYDGLGSGDHYSTAIAVDANGNVFVTGTSQDGGYDYATVAYSNNSTPLWTNRYGDIGSDYAVAVGVDTNGTVFVTGYSSSGGLNYDFATVAYSNAGVPLWTNRCYSGASGWNPARAMAVSDIGNVYVAGLISFDTVDYATVAYSNTGLPLWTNYYNGSGNGDDWVLAVAADKTGNVFVTGYSMGSGGSYDCATVAYSSAGVPLWTNSYDGGGFDAGVSLGVDKSGNVFVAGVSSAGSLDYVTLAYSSSGGLLWANTYDGPANGGDWGEKLTLDKNGNVVVTGYSPNSSSGDDYATVAYSNGGVPLWTNRYDGPTSTSDYASAIAMDSGGNVYVTGSSGNGADCDFATIKYSAAESPFYLHYQILGEQLVLSWSDSGVGLQSALDAAGPFGDITGAASPYTNSISDGRQFFRLKK